MTSHEYSFQAGDQDHWRLIVDTSKPSGFVAAIDFKNEKLRVIEWDSTKRHTDVLLKNYLNLSQNLDEKKLSEIIFIQGPGSFTGLRVGAAFVKALSFSLNKIPITCRSAFLIDAYSVIRNKPDVKDFNVVIPSIGKKFFSAYFKYSNGSWIEKINFDGASERTFVEGHHFTSSEKALSDFQNLNRISNLDQGFIKALFDQSKIKFYSQSNTHLDLYPLYLRQSEAEEKIRYDKAQLQQIKKKQ